MTKEEFEKLTKEFRIDILEMVYNANSGHIGGSFSLIDILTYIIFEDSNIKESIEKYKEEFKNKNIKELQDIRKEIDKLIISKGHASPAMYSVLMYLGAVDKKELYSFRRLDGKLEGHISKSASNFIDYSGGALGQGLSFAVGVSQYFKHINKKRKIYAILGDGELDEGENYEGMMLASKLELDNLLVIVDKNGIQLDGKTEEILPLRSLKDKFLTFGFNVITAEGHNFLSIKKAFLKAKKFEKSGKPTVIIFNTIKGKGINFMENTSTWHGKAPSTEEYEAGVKELEGDLND